MAEGPALLGGHHGGNVDRRVRAQRHHVHVGPEAAALGQHAIAEQAAQIDHVGKIVVAGRVDVIGVGLHHTHRIRHRRIAPQGDAEPLRHETGETQPRQPA
jgi:hypothetical protein